jgi:hypothetical protein
MNIRLANAADDEALSRLLSETPMPGLLQLSPACGHSFYRALEVEGQDPVVLVAEQDGRLVGMGAAVVRRAYLEGRLARVRYLGSLRLAPAARGSRALARGYALMHRELSARQDDLMLTVIMDENQVARSILTGARGGLPTYQPLAGLVTYILPTSSTRADQAGIERGADAGELARFMQEVGPQHDLVPECGEADLQNGTGVFPGLSHRDFLVARRAGSIVGLLACWDTRARRQIRVAGYGLPLRLLRPLADRLARWNGWGGLPEMGSDIPVCYGALGLVKAEHRACWRDLVLAARAEAGRRGCAWLALTLDKSDERGPAMAALRALRLSSTLYELRWPGALFSSRSRRPGPLHVEAALL